MRPLVEVAGALSLPAGGVWSLLAPGSRLPTTGGGGGAAGDPVRPRADSMDHYVRKGGLHGTSENEADLVARTTYFKIMLDPGPWLDSGRLEEAARTVFPEARQVRPKFLRLNVMIPGQELAVHTDVPSFSGIGGAAPEWLRVVMHGSGLFGDHRIRVANAIIWAQPTTGGELIVWRGGPDRDPVVARKSGAAANVLDADSTFHGVTRVGPPQREAAGALVRPGDHLVREGAGRWALVRADGRRVLALGESELRATVMWKASCHGPAQARPPSPLTLADVRRRIEDDLLERGAIPRRPASPASFARAALSAYVSPPDWRPFPR